MGNFALVLALLLVSVAVLNVILTLRVERRKREVDQQSKNLEIHNIELPVGAFTNGDVINYEGLNYYRACDVYVADRPEGGHTFCVLPVNHEGKRHTDFNGSWVEL